MKVPSGGCGNGNCKRQEICETKPQKNELSKRHWWNLPSEAPLSFKPKKSYSGDHNTQQSADNECGSDQSRELATAWLAVYDGNSST